MGPQGRFPGSPETKSLTFIEEATVDLRCVFKPQCLCDLSHDPILVPGNTGSTWHHGLPVIEGNAFLFKVKGLHLFCHLSKDGEIHPS